MKTTIKIAKTELAMLFYSPIAWFLLVVFMFQCGLAYTGALENIVTSQSLGGRSLRYLMWLTSRVFAPPYGIFPSVASNLYLYLPLLTMGLMSREISSGTIKLLYSSPIKVREIIFGKFIAMLVYNLLLVAILTILVVSGLFNIKSADSGMLFAGLFGIYLLLCTYAAIGLFMSCLTSYQVVAALSTLVLLGALSYIGTLWQDLDFVRDLTYFLSISGRAQHMMVGLITTKDILYFLVIMYIFLGFAIYKLQSDRESKSWMIKASRYVVIVISGLAIGYITSRPGVIGYLDATATKSRTLTVNTQKVIKEMGDEPLEVTSYINLLDGFYWYGVPSQRNQDMNRWEPYQRFKPDIKFNYVYYYDSSDKNMFKYNPGVDMKGLAERYAKTSKVDISRFKTPAEIRQIIDLRPEQNRYVMQLKYKGKTTFLRLFNDMQVFPSETETSAALKRLMQARLPKIAFVEGELERSIDKIGDKHYKILTNDITFRHSLVNQGFDVETVSLKDQEIPKDIAALVIADPKIAFDTVALTKIRQYIAEGGNLMIAGEPGKQDIMNPILQPLGVHMMDGMLVEQSKEFSPDLVMSYLTPESENLGKALKGSIEDSIRVSLPNAAALTYDASSGFTVKPLLMTDGKKSWNRKKKLDLDMIESADGPSPMGSYGGGGMTMSAVAVSSGGGSTPMIVTAGAVNGSVKKVVKADTGKGVTAGANFHAVQMTPEQQKRIDSFRAAHPPVQLTAEQQKTRDSLRTVIQGIMKGSGTDDDKKKALAEVFAKMRKDHPMHAQQMGQGQPMVVMAPGAQTTMASAHMHKIDKQAMTKATTVTAGDADGGDENSDNASSGRGHGRNHRGGGGQQQASGAQTLTFSPADGDVGGALPAAISMTRTVNGKEQRIVVVGDADFLSNSELGRNNAQTSNFEFSTAIFGWFSYNEFPVDSSRPKSEDTRVNVTDASLTTLKVLFLGILPGLLLIFGTVLLIRRKRK